MGCGVSHMEQEAAPRTIPGVLPNMHELLQGAKTPQADCVVPLLYLGNIAFARDKTKLKELGVKRIVNVTPEAPCFPGSFMYESLRVEDTQTAVIQPHLLNAVGFIAGGIDAGEAVFVHCEMGMSRSSTVVIAYLLHQKGWSVRRGLLQVKVSRPIARITRSFVFTLLDIEMKLVRESTLDQELLIEEGLEGSTEGGVEPLIVTASSLQLFFFPSPDLVADNLKSVGLFPPQWDTFKHTFLCGVDFNSLSMQNPPLMAEVLAALKTSNTARAAYSKLKKDYASHISPFVK